MSYNPEEFLVQALKRLNDETDRKIRELKMEIADEDARAEVLEKKNQAISAQVDYEMTVFAKELVEREAKDGPCILAKVFKDCESAGETGVEFGAVLEEKVKAARIERAKVANGTQTEHEQAPKPRMVFVMPDSDKRQIEEAERETEKYKRECAEYEAEFEKLHGDMDYRFSMEAKRISEAEPELSESEVKARVEQLIKEWAGILGPEDDEFVAREVTRAISAWQSSYEQAAQLTEGEGEQKSETMKVEVEAGLKAEEYDGE